MRQRTPFAGARDSLPFHILAPFACCASRCFSATLASTRAQEPPPNPAASQSGTSTGGTHAPVKDAQQRPITAVGFVEGASVVYVYRRNCARVEPIGAGMSRSFRRAEGSQPRLPTCDLVVAPEGRASRESETLAACDMRGKLAGSLKTSARTTKERGGRVEVTQPD